MSLVCAALLFSSMASAQLEVPPHLQFKKIRTPHFDIIFNAERQDLGQLYAQKLEKAYRDLSPYFSAKPETTVVIINDKTDVTNGYATRVPYPHIMAYPVLPGPQDSLADTGDWAYELLAHEYTHVLNFEPATGVMTVVRSIFGTIAAPNLLLPRWWKEGLAVEMETRLGNHGRLRSVYQDATLRALVDSNRLFDYSLAEANEFIPSWPEGSRPYLFGSLMWSQIVSEKGPKIIDDLNLHHSRRVPFFVEEPARVHLGKTYVAQYEEALEAVQEKVQEQLVHLKKVPPTTFTPLNLKAKYASAPSLSPDGKYLALISVSESDRREIKIILRNTETKNFVPSDELKTLEEFKEELPAAPLKDTPDSGSIQRVSWFPNSNKLVYDKISATNRIERYSDLWTYDLKKQKTLQLTKSLRAREPSVSPDGKQIAFVKLSGGKTELAIVQAEDGNAHTTLFAGGLQDRISYPIFLSNTEILFSLRKDGGQEGLYKYNLTDKSVNAVVSNIPNVRFARIIGDSVFFVSSASGTQNIYKSDFQFKNIHPITHTLTAFFTFDLDPLNKDIYATQMSEAGPQVVHVSQNMWTKTPSQVPQIKNLMADRYPAVAIEKNADSATYEVEDYSTLGYLTPRYWIPFFANSSTDSGMVFQATTSGFDPLKKHTYSLLGEWSTYLNRGSIQGTYINQQTSLPVVLSLYQLNSYLSDKSNRITDTGSALSVLPDVFFLSRYLNLQVGWQHFERATNFSGEIKRTGPFAILSYADYSRAGDQISPEEGFGGYLGAYNYIEAKNYLNHSQFTAGGVAYLAHALPERHALMLKFNGVYTPETIPSVFGSQTSALPISSDSILPIYLMRGYKTGQFFGRNLANANFEYRFPLKKIYRGSGTDPIFLQRLNGAIVADAVALDGYFVNEKENIYEKVSMQRSFFTLGAEAKLQTTIGYAIPIDFVLGYYVAMNLPDGPAGSVGVTLQYGAF